MNGPLIREFRLSAAGCGPGLSCDKTGAFVGSVPLLKRMIRDQIESWEPRDCDELSHEISRAYGLPIDFSSRAEGLRAIARALNAGDTARAQFAALFLLVPKPPDLSKSISPGDDFVALARALYETGLLAKEWDSTKHPRWLAGDPNRRGGRFSPKGAETGTRVDVGVNNARRLRSWEDFASQQHVQPIGGNPVWVGPSPELAVDQIFELYAELETELDAGFALRPGPYAGRSIPASGPGITRSEQEATDENGAESGCHSCGARTPGTASGHWIGDHQPPTGLNFFGRPQSLYPQCAACSARQGGTVRQVLRRLFELGKLTRVIKGLAPMPILEHSVAAPNSILFIDDPTHDYTIPDDIKIPLTCSSSCIVVSTLESSRGDTTTVRLGSDIGTPAGRLIFDGTLETPGKCLEIGTSWLDQILCMQVNNTITRIKIWTNDPREPDQIWIEAR